jgi:hypothetical protein
MSECPGKAIRQKPAEARYIEEKLIWRTALSAKRWNWLINYPGLNIGPDKKWFVTQAYYSLCRNNKASHAKSL